MTISTPDTFVINSSGKYILSIRLCPDGFSFSAYNPDEKDSFFYRDVSFDRSIPYINSLKETFFENEILVRNYRKVSVLIVSPQYTLVPDRIAGNKKETKFLSFTFSDTEKKTLKNNLKDEQADLLFDMNEEVFEFCSRSTVDPTFIHHMTPQLAMLKKQSVPEERNRLFVIAHPKMIDLICFNEGKLLLANSFTYKQFDDLLYHIFNVWRHLDMDQLNDRLFLTGETKLCNHLTQSLRPYIRHIGRIEMPSEAYLMGGEILQAPLDVILHTVCES